jgi:hypothetical protein
MTHDLKTWPEYYEQVENGSKSFEIRKNDRHFRVGDILVLKEWDSISGYSGRETVRTVKYIFLGGTMGVQEGFCVMAI